MTTIPSHLEIKQLPKIYTNTSPGSAIRTYQFVYLDLEDNTVGYVSDHNDNGNHPYFPTDPTYHRVRLANKQVVAY